MPICQVWTEHLWLLFQDLTNRKSSGRFYFTRNCMATTEILGLKKINWDLGMEEKRSKFWHSSISISSASIWLDSPRMDAQAVLHLLEELKNG